MPVVKINNKERELIREINRDPKLLDSALQHVRELKQAQQLSSHQYSIDELKTRLEKARNSAKEGKYKTQSEMRSKYAL